MSLVSELVISAGFFFPLLSSVPLTIAVNDRAEWLDDLTVGDGDDAEGKTHFQTHTPVLFINLCATWPTVAFIKLRALSKCFKFKAF